MQKMVFLPSLLICFSLFSFSPAIAQPAKTSVAVHDLQAKGVDQSESEVISERLRSDLINTGLFRVMERGQMESVLKEQMFQQSGVCTDQACLVEMGQILGVERILAGTIGKVGKTYTLQVRVIDVATGEILSSFTSDCKCDIDEVLQKSTRDIAQQIVQNAGPAAKPQAAAPVPAKPEPPAPATALAEKTEPKAAPPAPSAEKKSGSGKIIIIAGVSALAVGGGIAAYLVLSGGGSQNNPATAPVQVQIP